MKSLRLLECNVCHRIIEQPENTNQYMYCPYCGSQISPMNGRTRISLDEDIERIVYNWLSKTLSIDEWLVSETIRNQMATVFLLLWPILETQIFNGDMSHNQMKQVAGSAVGKIPRRELDEISQHFYERYQDRRMYNGLVQGRNWPKIERILDKPFIRVYENEKILLLIFVVYRYRNNIFHGIKTIRQWQNYSYEIQLCIRFMVLLGDACCVKNMRIE